MGLLGVSWLTLSFSAATLILIIFPYVKRFIKLFWESRVFKGPKSYPLLGNTLQLNVTSQEIFRLFQQWAGEFPGMYRLWIGPYFTLVVYSAKLIEPLLKCNSNLKKGFSYEFLKGFTGNGLLTAEGDHWHHRRKLLTPAFHLGILESYSVIMAKNSRKLVDFLRKHEGGEKFNVIPYAKHLSLDMICESAMGTEINSLEQSSLPYVQAIHNMSKVIVDRSFKAVLQLNAIYRFSSLAKIEKKAAEGVNEFCMKVLSNRRKEIEAKVSPVSVSGEGKRRSAFLDLLLQSTDRLTERDILDEVNTFVFAGHDTTGSGISWTLYLLGHHPEAQERIIEEIDSVVDNFNEKGLSFQDLANLKYLDRCIKETLRMFPPVPLISREIIHPIKTDEGTIPAGTNYIIDFYKLHRDPDYFQNPDKFDPDRFLEEIEHNFAYVPFSAGPRNCIGQKIAMMEIKYVVSHIVKSYVIRSVCPMDGLKLLTNVVLENEGGIELQLTRRK